MTIIGLCITLIIRKDLDNERIRQAAHDAKNTVWCVCVYVGRGGFNLKMDMNLSINLFASACSDTMSV